MLFKFAETISITNKSYVRLDSSGIYAVDSGDKVTQHHLLFVDYEQ